MVHHGAARLEVAGADLTMIQVICTEADGSGAPIFPRDLFLIAEADPKPALVVIDAWLDTVPAALSVRDPQQARLALHPWKEIATVTDAAMWLLCHTNRVDTPNARDRYGITGELRKKARMTLFAQSDEDDNLVVGPEKMNNAAPIPASKFTITTVQHFAPTDDHDGTVPLLAYLGESDQTAREHIADNYADGHDTADKDDVIGWLAVFLATGPRWATEIYTAADTAGYSKGKLKRAKTKLNVSADRESFSGPWFWALPQHEGTAPTPMSARAFPWTPWSSRGNASTSQDALRTNGETRGTPETPRFEPPTGPGRCCECGFHIETMGHRPDCTANEGDTA